VHITDASDFEKGWLARAYQDRRQLCPGQFDSVFGELIDDGFEVVRRPNTYFIDRTSDHFRANIQYGHNTVRQSANESCNLVKPGSASRPSVWVNNDAGELIGVRQSIEMRSIMCA
jgi:hypothetical protein